jgi:hypothetical protein
MMIKNKNKNSKVYILSIKYSLFFSPVQEEDKSDGIKGYNSGYGLSVSSEIETKHKTQNQKSYGAHKKPPYQSTVISQ